MNRIRFVPTLVLLCGAIAILSACGERTEPTAPKTSDHVRVTLDRAPNASQACFYAAQAGGDFQAAGLDVSLVSPPSPGRSLEDLTAERSDMALTSQPDLLIKRGTGAALVSVATVLREPLWKINPPKAQAKTAVKGAKPKAGPVPHPWTTDNLPAGAKGVSPYPGMLVVARRADLGPKGSVARRFVQAVARGCTAVGTDSQPAITAIASAPGGQSATLAKRELPSFLGQFSPPQGKPWGWQDPTSWNKTLSWMTADGLIGPNADPDPGYTNEFLAGQGV